MQSLFGKLMVTLALRFKVPIAVVYYGIWAIVGLVYVIVFGWDKAMREMEFGLIFIVPIFGVLFPLIWTFTSGGRFWKTPNESTMNELWPK